MRTSRVIFDVLYGFIPITEWEEKIINSPFFQRLRWIKQLGFANYIFPGAEHNRFAHTIGVMHSMDRMIRYLGIGVTDHELFSRKSTNKTAMLHKCLRISALLHDIGTFPFSHAIEYAYMRHGNDSRRGGKSLKSLPNSHEHLGSFIIKNTDYEGGITRILNEHGLDTQLISKIIKGDSPYLIANQLMHSDLDADRMDYLMRDSHYTGIKYGQFDRDYILANLVAFNAGKGQQGFGVRPNAVHAVEDFLIARFWWYSQVIKNPGSAKFDIMSTHVASGLLQADLMHQFQDLLDMVADGDERFFWWNDVYFMSRCQEIRQSGAIQDPKLSELIEMLLYRKAPKTIHHPMFQHRFVELDEDDHSRDKLVGEILEVVDDFNHIIEKHGTGKEWILVDIPQKDVVFTHGLKKLRKKSDSKRFHLLAEPVKVVDRNGRASLLIEESHSLMKHLSGFTNFCPSVYANDAAYRLLQENRAIPRRK